jgi:hypothetical protein
MRNKTASAKRDNSPLEPLETRASRRRRTSDLEPAPNVTQDATSVATPTPPQDNVMTADIGSWTNPVPAQGDHNDTDSDFDGHSQDTHNRKPPPNPHSLQAHVTSWLANNDEPPFAQFQLLYKALLDEEPEEFAELLENHYESAEPWPMVFLARDTKGTIRLLHSIAQVPMKPSPDAPASTWYNKWVAFANTLTILRPCPCVLKNDFLGPHSYINQDDEAANALAPEDFGKAIQGTNPEDRANTPAICPLLPQWAEQFLELDALTVAEVLVTLRRICNELDERDDSIDKTHPEIKNYAYSLLYKAASGRGQAVSVALSPSFPDETFESWSLTHLAKTFPEPDHPAHGSASTTAHPFGVAATTPASRNSAAATQASRTSAAAPPPPAMDTRFLAAIEALATKLAPAPGTTPEKATPNKWTANTRACHNAWARGPADSINPVFESLAKAPKHEKRTIARNFFQELSRQKDSFVGFSPSEELVDDLINGSYAPPLPATPTKWHRGFTPMAFVARSVQDLAKQREQRDLTSHYNGLLQISYSECKKLESGPPTVPTSLPGILDVLEKCADFHSHCWGDRNGIARDVKAIRYNLRRLQPRLANVPKFAPQRAPTILWTLANAISDYYHTVTTARDFADAATLAGDPPYVDSTIDRKDLSLVTLQQAADLPDFLQPLPTAGHQKPARQPDRPHERSSPGRLSDPIPRTGYPPRTPPPTGRGNQGGSQQQQQGPRLNLNTPAPLRHLFARLPEAKWQDLRLNAILETANMTIASLKDMVQAAPHTCMRFAVCGRCNNTACRLKHTVLTLDDTTAQRVAVLLTPGVEGHLAL